MAQAFRSLGLPGLVKEYVRIEERERGCDEATFVESFVILNAVGGECIISEEPPPLDRLKP